MQYLLVGCEVRRELSDCVADLLQQLHIHTCGMRAWVVRGDVTLVQCANKACGTKVKRLEWSAVDAEA